MIQRVQTLFLLGAATLLFSMLFSKIAYSPVEIVKYSQLTPIFILILVTFLISFFSIFLYRHRVIQIRMCTLNSLILIGLQIWVIYLFFNRPQGTAFSITAVFPIVAAILSFTAMRYIARDEARVRASSRLRQ